MSTTGYYARSGNTFFKWPGASGNRIYWTWHSTQSSYPYDILWYTSGGAWYSTTGYKNDGFYLDISYGCRPAKFSGTTLSISACTFVSVSVSNASGGGSVSGGGSNIVAGVQQITITASPSADWKLSSWSDGNTSTSRTFSPTSDMNLTATFVRSHYNIGVSSAGNSTVSIWPGTKVPANSSFHITCNPSAHYKFSSWIANTGQTYTNNPATLTATQDMSFSARVYLAEWLVKTSASGNGRTTIDGQGNSTELYFESGVSVTVKAFSNDPSRSAFSHWEISGNPVGLNESYIFTMATQAVSIVAVFFEKAYEVTATSSSEWGRVAIIANDETKESTDSSPSITAIAYWINNPCVLISTVKEFGVFKGWVDEEENTVLDGELYLSFEDTGIHTYTALFEEASLYSLDLEIGAGSQPSTGVQNALSVKSHKGQNEDGLYYEGIIEVQCTTTVGWRVKQWNGTGDIPTIQLGDDGFDSVFRFMLNHNATITAFFELNQYDVTWVVDGPSTGKGEIDASGATEFTYGAVVTLVATASTGSEFRGWYTPTGGLLSNTNEITITVISDVSYIAKFGSVASASFIDVGSSTGLSKAIISSGGIDSEVEIDFIYGETLSFRVDLAEGDYFKGWYLDGAILPDYGLQFSFVPLNGFLVKALVEDTPSPFYVKMMNEVIGYGELSLIGNHSELMTAQSSWLSDVEDRFGTIDLLNNLYFKFTSVDIVAIFSIKTVSVANLNEFILIKRVFLDDAWNDGAQAAIPKNKEASLVLTDNCTIKATYYSATLTTVTLSYVSESNPSMGALGFNRTGKNEYVGASVRADFTQGVELFIIAVAKSGYRFVGWYTDRNGTNTIDGAGIEHRVNVTSAPSVYYAKFTQDRNAVYEWEGEDVNKLIEWESKQFVSPKPFNPSAISIDADVYPVEAFVKMSSSPSSSLNRTVRADLLNQNGKKLQMTRPEKYVSVLMKSVYPINSVVISTSMGGLRE